MRQADSRATAAPTSQVIRHECASRCRPVRGKRDLEYAGVVDGRIQLKWTGQIANKMDVKLLGSLAEHQDEAREIVLSLDS